MNQYFENLKKSMGAEATPELLNNLTDELKVFFQILRVKVESKDPILFQAAKEEIANLKALLETHPLVQKQ